MMLFFKKSLVQRMSVRAFNVISCDWCSELDSGETLSTADGEDTRGPVTGGDDSPPPKPIDAFGKNIQCVGVLPGMGCYSDSSDSSNDSNSEADSSDDDANDHNHRRDITGRFIRSKKNKECC